MDNIKNECTSIFKNKDDETIKKEFNDKWVQIINRMENYKTYIQKTD